MFLKISTMMLCLGLIIGMTNKVAYSANYLKKDGLFDTGLVFKGKKLNIKWGAKQPSTSSKRGALFYFHGDGGNGQGALGSLSDIVFKYGYHAVAVKHHFQIVGKVQLIVLMIQTHIQMRMPSINFYCITSRNIMLIEIKSIFLGFQVERCSWEAILFQCMDVTLKAA